MEVLFPLVFMRPDPTLVDPENLDTIYEYYLVENLALGLLRDGVAASEGYVPLIAQAWTQRDAKTWDFTLRTDLTWSNGEPITGAQVAQHFRSLKSRRSRHLSSLAALADATYSEDSQTLTLSFSEPTNPGLLHELTLADAVLVYPGPVGRSWRVTSGAYSVQDYQPETANLTLTLNSRSPLASASSPTKVHLFWFADPLRRSGAFKAFPVDLYYQSSNAFRQTSQAIRKNAPQKYPGAANTVSFFRFDAHHELCRNLDARREFADIVQTAFENISLADTIHFDRQLIPPGYAGRLDSYEPSAAGARDVLRGKVLRVVLPSSFKEIANIAGAELIKVGASHGATLVVSYGDEEPVDGPVPFAAYRNFKGNQADPSGSWNFLFTPEVGDLAPFRDDVAQILSEVSTSESTSQRDALLQGLHRMVLDRAFAVPFMVEANSILASNRVGLQNINPFDLRLRFYDVIWK